jgi:hypothetical protein
MPTPRLRLPIALTVAVAALTGCSDSDTAATTSSVKPADAGAEPAMLAADAFVWGYPLAVTQRTLQTFAGLIGTNNLFNQAALSDASTRLIVAPNQDTLYSVAVVDVRSEPLVLTVPDVHDRYWTYQFLDAWTNSFHYIGTRTTDGNGGTFVITAPGYAGTLPAGTTKIESPTPTMFLLGRYLVRDIADTANVTSLVRTLVPLHTVTGETAPPPNPPLGAPPGKPQEVGNDGATFFDELGDALGVNPPASDFDRHELERFASLGIGPNLHPTADADATLRSALESGVTDGMQRIADATLSGGEVQNGWTTHLDIGVYHDDSLTRAAVSKFGWGANVPEEAVYPISVKQADGAAYTGSNDHVMRFDANDLPPIDPTHGFWSLTLYGTDMFFVENPIRRYAIGDRTAGLTFNADGSLDLFIQNSEPPQMGNWLPAPAGEFVLVLRLYLPQASVLDGTYVYPAVTTKP